MIKILCASTGNNVKLSEEINEVLKELGQETELLILEDFDLPLYSSKMEEKVGRKRLYRSLDLK